jgi:outer membrane protein assembly factor BamA
LPHHIDVTAGVAFTELQMDPPRHGYQKANGINGSITQTLGSKKADDYQRHSFSWSYSVHSGIAGMGSDFSYRRFEGSATYSFMPKKKQTLTLDFRSGGTSGISPMFERFSIGNASTLRGWTKYEISPLGGGQKAYASASYSYTKHFKVSYDMGSVWDDGHAIVVRESIVLGFMLPGIDIPFSLGIPLRHVNAKPMFMVGY